MSLVQVDVEISKLARLLEAEPEQLGYLRQVDWQDIRDLREQMTVVMFETDRQMLQRVAGATRLLPPKLTAAIGERAFGPLLSARVTGLLEPERAVDIAGRLPTRFLADLAEQLDPRRASRVVAEIPRRQIAAIAQELAQRGEHGAMGGFVGHLSEAAMKAALDVVDDQTLLRTAYVAESKGSLDALVAIVPEQRLASIMCTATEAGLWREALDVLGHVSERRRGQLGDIAAAQDDEVLDGLVRAAQRDGLWADVLPIARAMSPSSRARFAKLRMIQTRPVLSSIVDAAKQQGLWSELLVLLPLLPVAARRRVAALGTGFGRGILEQIIAAAHEQELWPPLIQFATELEERTQRALAKLIADGDDELLAGLLDAVADERLEADLVRLVARLAPADMRRLSKRLVQLAGDELCDALAGAAQAAELAALHKALASA